MWLSTICIIYRIENQCIWYFKNLASFSLCSPPTFPSPYHCCCCSDPGHTCSWLWFLTISNIVLTFLGKLSLSCSCTVLLRYPALWLCSSTFWLCVHRVTRYSLRCSPGLTFLTLVHVHLFQFWGCGSLEFGLLCGAHYTWTQHDWKLLEALRITDIRVARIMLGICGTGD